MFPSGMKFPVKGAAAEAMDVVADIVKTVFTKLSPLPPLRLLKVREVPEGEIK
jgi:hypothetical protein